MRRDMWHTLCQKQLGSMLRYPPVAAEGTLNAFITCARSRRHAGMRSTYPSRSDERWRSGPNC